MKQNVQYLVGIFVTGVAFMVFIAPQVHAESPSWLNGSVTATIDSLPYPWEQSGCDQQLVRTGLYMAESWNLCMYQQDGFRYTYFSPMGGPYYNFLFGRSNSDYVYRVTNLVDNFITIPHSKDLLIFKSEMPEKNAKRLYIVRDFASKLIAHTNSDSTTSYTLPDEALTPVLYNEGGETGEYTQVAMSKNAEWLVLQRYNNGGFVRINLETLEAKWFAKYSPPQEINAHGETQFAITDDGRWVAATGKFIGVTVYDLENKCGTSSMHDDDHTATVECPGISFFTQVKALALGVMDYINYPQFDEDVKRLSVYTIPVWYLGTPDTRWVTLTLDGDAPSRLDYLALGDSYSSGEGDIGKNPQGGSYYRTLTDVDNYNCHVSSRSYPFLLRNSYGLTTDKMQSVACSGAKVFLDYYQLPTNYRGQGNRLAGKNLSERTQLQQDALDHFTPGLTPQLEFVKKYQPKVVTLTGGGNDVGFADILQYCASPTWEMIFVDDTCGYAKWDSDLKKMLYDSIDSQYGTNQLLLTKIKAASPDTRIVIVGYPSFVADGITSVCGSNAGALNRIERYMLNRAVSYMNTMLKGLARDNDVSYVDIENSLHGGRICEGAEYVTGLTDIGTEKIKKLYFDETFHPNAAGHQKIAERIEQSHVFTANSVPTVSEYEPNPNAVQSFPYEMISGQTTLRYNRSFNVTINPHTFQPSTSIVLTAFSEPTVLGDFTVDSDGGATMLVDATKLLPGHHVLVVQGMSYSGEPIRYYQFFTVDESQSSEKIETPRVENSPTPAGSYGNTQILAGSNLVDVPQIATHTPYFEKGMSSRKNKLDYKEGSTNNIIRTWLFIGILCVIGGLIWYGVIRKAK